MERLLREESRSSGLGFSAVRLFVMSIMITKEPLKNKDMMFVNFRYHSYIKIKGISSYIVFKVQNEEHGILNEHSSPVYPVRVEGLR